MIAISNPRFRSRAALFALFASLGVAGAAAATQPPASPTSTPRITITDTELAPSVVRTAEGHAFVLANDSTGIARVEFKLPLGDGIACSTRTRTPRLARSFVVGQHETLVCYAKPGQYEFTAYRIVSIPGEALRLARSEGTILVS